MADQTLLQTALLANLLDENLTPSSYVDFRHFIVHRGSKVTDALVQQVCAFNPGIRIMNLENCCNNVTDLGILAIATYCHHLEKIELSDCCKLTHVGVRALALNCPQLNTISFKRCSKIDDRSLRIIAAYVRCLEELELEGCMQISDCGVAEIAQ
jgi:F-box/leucine-rich repeat protein 2/20